MFNSLKFKIMLILLIFFLIIAIIGIIIVTRDSDSTVGLLFSIFGTMLFILMLILCISIRLESEAKYNQIEQFKTSLAIQRTADFVPTERAAVIVIIDKYNSDIIEWKTWGNSFWYLKPFLYSKCKHMELIE